MLEVNDYVRLNGSIIQIAHFYILPCINNKLLEFCVYDNSEFEVDLMQTPIFDSLEQAFESVIDKINNQYRAYCSKKLYDGIKVEKSTLEILTYNLSQEFIEFSTIKNEDNKVELFIEASFIVNEYSQFDDSKVCKNLDEAVEFLAEKEKQYDEFQHSEKYEHIL